MEIGNSGTLALSAVKSIYGNVATNNSLSGYYASCSGVPSGGPISMSNLRGKKLAMQHPPGDMTANSTNFAQSKGDGYGTVTTSASSVYQSFESYFAVTMSTNDYWHSVANYTLRPGRTSGRTPQPLLTGPRCRGSGSS